MVLVAVLVLLALAGVAAWMLLPRKDKGPSYPSAWDSRVAPYAKVAERERGLYFRHPVNVRFLPAAAFEKTVTTDEKDLDDEDREELEQTTGLLRAFGLLRGDVDLFSSLNEAHGAGTLAYYSFEDERITIRGNAVTPAVRATLVHELTHVLQDQHFDLGDRMQKLDKESEKGPSSSEASVLQALGEGDANRIEELYREGLTARQRKVLDAARQGENAGADKRLKRVPKVLLTMIASPYTLGQGLVQAADADGGNTRGRQALPQGADPRVLPARSPRAAGRQPAREARRRARARQGREEVRLRGAGGADLVLHARGAAAAAGVAGGG